jgi:uncharacterized protein YecE (DUF72 family)
VVIRIGTSGWSYDHWQPELYPPGLTVRDRLACYASSFGTAELNSSFYRWPRPAAFGGWRRRLPDGFRLSAKAPRGPDPRAEALRPEEWLSRIRDGWHELGDTDLRWWADRIREWDAEGKDAFVYFNNDGGANAVRSARTISALLSR